MDLEEDLNCRIKEKLQKREIYNLTSKNKLIKKMKMKELMEAN